MSFFKRKSTKTCWKDESGNIRCLGDDCKTTCDNTCPIWLNTQGVNCLVGNNPHQAVLFLEKVIEIEPNFVGAYNNLAAAYGMTGQHKKAYAMYGKKLDAVKYDPDALYGIALASKKLGRVEEALAYCEGYEKHHGLDERIKAIMIDCGKVFDESLPEEDLLEELSPLDYCTYMLEVDKEEGFIDYKGGFPHIPELLEYTSDICTSIVRGIGDYAYENNKLFGLCGSWCAYAGIGAVLLWNKDWPSLKEQGLFHSLTNPRGIDEMDEYVCSLMNMDFESDESKKLRNNLYSWGVHFEEDAFNNGVLDKELFSNFIQAMYMYGVVYGMSLLGMY